MTGGVTTRTSQNAARALGVRRWSGRIARGESIGESVGPSSGASPSSPASSSASITARGSRPRRSSAAADSPARLTRCSVPPARGASPRGARIPRVPASAQLAWHSRARARGRDSRDHAISRVTTLPYTLSRRPAYLRVRSVARRADGGMQTIGALAALMCQSAAGVTTSAGAHAHGLAVTVVSANASVSANRDGLAPPG